MKKLLLASMCATALGLAACGGADEANNMDATFNDEMNMDMNATDMNMDANMDMDMNATDMNMDMNATDNAMDNMVDNTTTNTGY